MLPEIAGAPSFQLEGDALSAPKLQALKAPSLRQGRLLRRKSGTPAARHPYHFFSIGAAAPGALEGIKEFRSGAIFSGNKKPVRIEGWPGIAHFCVAEPGTGFEGGLPGLVLGGRKIFQFSATAVALPRCLRIGRKLHPARDGRGSASRKIMGCRAVGVRDEPDSRSEKTNIQIKKYRLSILRCAYKVSMVFAILFASALARAAQGRVGGLRESADEDFADVGGGRIASAASRSVFARPHGRSVDPGFGDPRALLCEF
jgi:hypothetical protein